MPRRYVLDLPATRQRWESRLYPQPKQVLDLAIPKDARLSWPICYVKADWLGIEPATCQSQVQRPTAAPPHLDIASLPPSEWLLGTVTWSKMLKNSDMLHWYCCNLCFCAIFSDFIIVGILSIILLLRLSHSCQCCKWLSLKACSHVVYDAIVNKTWRTCNNSFKPIHTGWSKNAPSFTVWLCYSNKCAGSKFVYWYFETLIHVVCNHVVYAAIMLNILWRTSINRDDSLSSATVCNMTSLWKSLLLF